MSIRIEQPGASTVAAQAGTMIGKAERAKEDRATAERASAQASSQAAEVQARQTAMDWELQKMMFNSQQDFAQEQRLRQAQFEGRAKAEEWEVEKMEIRSRIDFEAEEKERRRVMDEAVVGLKSIDKYVKSGKGTEVDVAALRLNYEIQKESGKAPATSLLPTGTDRAQYGTPPWYLSPEYKDTPEGKAALTKTPEEKPIFTPYNVQKGLGILSTGSPESPLGIPLPVLTTQKEHEQWAERNWGPSWKVLVPDAVGVINKKFGISELKPLNDNIMRQFLISTGGNVSQAKNLARESGYKVD